MDYDSGALDVPLENPLVKMAEELSGSRSVSVPFGTEAPLYASVGIPSIVLGPGSVEAHVADEYVPVGDIRRASTIYAKLIDRICCSPG